MDLLKQKLTDFNPEGELKISFGYQCNVKRGIPCDVSNGYKLPEVHKISSICYLFGAASSANASLANTNICNEVIGGEILPSLDSPNSFRKEPSWECFEIIFWNKIFNMIIFLYFI